MNRKLQTLLITLFGAGTLIASGSASVSAADSVTSAYNELISGYSSSNEEDGYALLDLNQDGIPELFLVTHIPEGRFIISHTDLYTCVDAGGFYEAKPVALGLDALTLYAPEDGNGFLTSTLEVGNGHMNFYRHIFRGDLVEQIPVPDFSGILDYDTTNAYIDRNPPLSFTPFSFLISEQNIPAATEMIAEETTQESYEEIAQDDSWDAVEVEPSASEAPVDLAVSGLVAGLSEYDLETILAYGPQEISGLFDDRCAHQLLNQVAQSKRVETGSYAYKTTINLEFMNSLANAYGDYNYANGNFNIIERGRYICYALAQINFSASVSNITVESNDGSYALVYDYQCHKSDPGVSDQTTVCKKRARLTPLGNGTYRIASIETIAS